MLTPIKDFKLIVSPGTLVGRFWGEKLVGELVTAGVMVAVDLPVGVRDGANVGVFVVVTELLIFLALLFNVGVEIGVIVGVALVLIDTFLDPMLVLFHPGSATHLPFAISLHGLCPLGSLYTTGLFFTYE